MLYRSPIAAHHIVPSGLSKVQNHVQLKLIESHNFFADGNCVVHLLMLGNGSDSHNYRLERPGNNFQGLSYCLSYYTGTTRVVFHMSATVPWFNEA